MNKKAQIQRRLVTIIGYLLNVPAENVHSNAHLLNDLGADSLFLTRLWIALEDEFEVLIEDHEILTLKTVQDIEKLILLRIESSK